MKTLAYSNAITNGYFDTDLSGWYDDSGSSYWDNGKAALQKCEYCAEDFSFFQTFFVRGNTLSIWQQHHHSYPYSGISIDIDGNILCGDWRSGDACRPDGTLTFDISAYKGGWHTLRIWVLAPYGGPTLIDNVENLYSISPICIKKRYEGTYSKDRYCYIGEGIFGKR